MATLRTLLFVALLAPLAASAGTPAPVRVHVVDDATLEAINGRYMGADMLVGVRIALVSQVQTAQGGVAQAQGVLHMTRHNGDTDIAVDTRAEVTAGSSGVHGMGDAIALGSRNLKVDGIAQVTQIAGHGNALSNLATIEVLQGRDALAALSDTSQFNQQSQATARAGAMHADVRFDGIGVQMTLTGPATTIGQQVRGHDGGVYQHARTANDGVSASNRMQLQFYAAPVPAQAQHIAGVHQALAALAMLPR